MTVQNQQTDGAIAGDDCSVTSTRNGAVAVVEFSRPPANYFNVILLRKIADAFEQAGKDPDIRAIVLCAAGKNFCAGADLATENNDPLELYAEAERIFSITKPIIAAVQGAAIGGGLGLALAADFRIVSPQARLSANFVKINMHPGFGMTYTLPRLVGPQQASLLFYTGRRVSGEQAVHLGLADVIAEPEHLQTEAISLATEIADNAPLAVEATRATLRAGQLDAVRAHTAHEARVQMELKHTEDFAEGVRAVSERRKGNWTRQ